MENVSIMLHMSCVWIFAFPLLDGHTTESIMITLVFHRVTDVIIVNGVCCFISPCCNIL